MQLRNVLLLAFLSASSAFIIPEGTGDGDYEHHVDANGVDVHVKIGNATDFSATELTAYTKRVDSIRSPRLQARGAFCNQGPDKANMHHGDTDAANADLYYQCSNYGPTKGRHDYYSVRGNTVAFFCNRAIKLVQCTATRRAQTSSYITQKCGWYHAGWWEQDLTSYGYDTGRYFCSECV
ncbi:hypothetical protein COCC4DRAFT_125994 [Bipolaris maydis ATCC 48331]|uniref:Uncharacterized protein n=2 Tax=Cochliobolus heterostrophus TaxID=5016 RepID=M2U8Q8_COCH5|nr:uncharacterized protein COCC4DRAFT_125994 [Bipolaris maydis ATCC 48331]EMD84632.1 hypothetical protein COCHEDRAFT_1122561 [Bipolaris maydis C5]KAJ5025172.1 hypothetical protein J3E73DRAFT_257926 [Bipolaris maydis]EMD90166.1 hypothetical protein COCHEDRAFT_1105053 [Bipolaris maydis C5]ENI09618.1 hypothetical protein COCC4DRAFT_125994 [Bipolaris maydis ATCC 48331]KAJ5063759.1 hypothetical protein J3E74DRAFT_286448 [Bipolaris maydis]